MSYESTQPRKKESLVATKAYSFCLRIIKLTKVLVKSYENIVIIKQILRSSTSIGANIEEALGSNSKKEFIHSMNIAKKEARETCYWLRLLLDCNKDNSSEIELLLRDCDELIKMLTSIVKTTSEK
jgi:four helix bundle protein